MMRTATFGLSTLRAACAMWAACAAMATGQAAAAEGPATMLAFVADHADLTVSRQSADYLRFKLAAWGPNWAWTGVTGKTASEGGASVATLKTRMGGTNVPFQVRFRGTQPNPKQLQLVYELQAEADTALTLVAIEMTPGRTFEGREAVVEAQGQTSNVRCPFERRGLGRRVERVQMTDRQGQTAVLRFDPPCDITSDGAARIVLAEGKLAGGQPRRQTITLDLPQAAQWYPSVAETPDLPGIETWYPWQAKGADGPSRIGLEDWLDAPAGKHGRIAARGDTLLYHGQPIKLWGLNLCYSACAPEKDLADKRAALYRKYGVNAVRLHKYADGPGWAGIQSPESFTDLDPEGLERMDYQVAKFKEAGIYVKLSAHFGAQKLGPADKQHVPFLDEFGKAKGKDDRVVTPHSAVHYSPELQQVQILQMVNLLKHRNPHTGLTYAADPAVAYIEIINEQSILFFTSMAPLKASPTLRKQVGERFCAWLAKKYGDQAKLAAAWGPQAFDSFGSDGFKGDGERLDRGNILPLGNPWYWDPQQLEGSQAFRKRRLLDTLAFLYQLECEFYDRYVAAVRAAGYEGEIVSSNWQAGRAFSHFANLHADARVGTIDRHNYFGGKQADASMLERAGSGMLSSGMQQVADRPFMLSEWIHVSPNEFGGEGAAIIGAYGMGLQGWDVSFMFQNTDRGAFAERIGRDRWEVTAPQVLGLFPAVARHVHRGDILAAEAVAIRNVHVPSLFEGKLSFDDQVVQGYDDKELTSNKVSARTLAAARCLVRFTKDYEDTPAFDLARHQQQGQIVSATGQLRWQEAAGDRGGWFTINTPATKAVVGSAQGSKLELGEVTIEPQTGHAAIYVTARQPQQTLADADECLVVALARARNTGMKFSPAGDRLLAPGQPPIIIEPVKARIAFRRRVPKEAIVLDHDGQPTGRRIALSDGALELDGARDRTPYYLLRF